MLCCEESVQRVTQPAVVWLALLPSFFCDGYRHPGSDNTLNYNVGASKLLMAAAWHALGGGRSVLNFSTCNQVSQLIQFDLVCWAMNFSGIRLLEFGASCLHSIDDERFRLLFAHCVVVGFKERLTLLDEFRQCEYVFGRGTLEYGLRENQRFQEKFGGASPGSGNLSASRIFFTDYSDDPWNRASVRREISDDLPYCFLECNGCGHCGAGVPANLTKCSDMETKYLDLWLNFTG